MIRIIISIFFLFIANLSSKENFFDISYTKSSYDFYKYSFSYARLISTRVVLGIGYNGYELEANSYNMIKTSFEFMLKDMSFSIKPFYFFERDNSRFYGAKARFDLISHGDERVTTYAALLSYAREEGVVKKDILFPELFIEKNFYDEFFIIFGFGASILNGGFKGVFDRSELLSFGYSGYISINPYSIVNISVARSFKPDFNSYLYLGFDKINGGLNRINSYLFGLRTYLEEKENYYLDFSFNLADKKVLTDEKIWRIVIGGVLR